jgi:hypothetical protein
LNQSDPLLGSDYFGSENNSGLKKSSKLSKVNALKKASHYARKTKYKNYMTLTLTLPTSKKKKIASLFKV